MTLEKKIAFVWQEKSLKLAMSLHNDIKQMRMIYDDVTQKYGSGLKHSGNRYSSFMERKWQIVYLRLLKQEHMKYDRVGEVYQG